MAPPRLHPENPDVVLIDTKQSCLYANDMNKMINRALCLLSGVFLLGIGVASLRSPETVADSIGYVLDTPMGLSEFMTVYGGLHVGIGISLLLGALFSNFRRVVLALLAISATASAVVRAYTLYTLRPELELSMILLAVEVVLALIGWIGWGLESKQKRRR